MKLEYLREFIALAKSLNYHSTAENLFITDSALSRHIVSIEDELGTRLFYRNTKKVELTPVGRAFEERVIRLLELYDDIRDDIALISSNFRNEITLGLPYYAMSDYIGAAQPLFTLENDDISLNYVASDPSQCFQNLFRGNINAAVMGKYPLPGAEQLTFVPLFWEPLIVIMSRRHPLAGRKSLKLADLAEESFINVDTPYHMLVWKLYVEHSGKRGVLLPKPQLKKQVEHTLIAAQSGEGIYISAWHMRNQLYPSTIAVPLDEIELCRRICLVYKTDRMHPELSKLLKVFTACGPFGWPEAAPPWTAEFNWPDEADMRQKIMMTT